MECEVDRIVLKWKAELCELEDQFLADINDRIFFFWKLDKKCLFDGKRFSIL